MSTTVGTLIRDSLLDIGVISPIDRITAEMADDGMRKLNTLLQSWSVEKLLPYAPTYESFTLSTGVASYTWGTGGTWTTARPIEIVNMDVVVAGSSSPVFEMQLNTYSNIPVKTTTGTPERFYFAPEHPLAKVYLYPAPASTYTLTVNSFKPFTAYTDLTDTILLPDEYMAPLELHLAMFLAPQYDMPISQVFYAEAQKAKETLVKLHGMPIREVQKKLDKQLERQAVA